MYTKTEINNKINMDYNKACKYSYLKGEGMFRCWCLTPLSTIFQLYHIAVRAGFRRREALGYSTCEAPPNPNPYK